MSIHDICRVEASEKVADFWSVIERDDPDRMEESREPCLPSAISPYLGDNWVGDRPRQSR